MLKVLVVGEICTDEFIYCNSNRLSPEAPVPILNPLEKKTNRGMAGNVSDNLKCLCDEVEITEWTQSQGIVKTRYVDKKSNHMFLRVDEGEKNISPIDLNEVKLKQLSCFDIVIVSDYDKGFLTQNDLKLIGKNSKLSILDTKKIINDDIRNSFWFIKLNEVEFLTNNLQNIDNVIITLGSKGCKFQDKIFTSPFPQETIDVSGAGDTFTVSFILKFFETDSIEKSLIFANEMASNVVSKRGVVTPC